jgi:predicted AlkP superfamily pyrophosphatase or phosphodiesterase
MRRVFHVVIFSLISLIGMAQKPRVIVIGFDGLGGYAFPNNNTPNINGIIQQGSYTFHAKAVVPSMSSPNWASMTNGVSPSKHKIWGNGWKLDKFKNKTLCGGEKGQISPTIFRLLREQLPDIKMDCVHDWNDFIRLTEKGVFNHAIDAKNEDETGSEAIRLILNDTPDFLFLHFDHVDHVGHEIGHNTPAYFKAVEKADSLTGMIVNALKEKGIYDETYIIITSDHGGRLKTHGGLTAHEMNIPWIIRGPNIKKGYHIEALVKQYDTAATIAKIFGIKIPDCWDGKAVMDVFEK